MTVIVKQLSINVHGDHNEIDAFIASSAGCVSSKTLTPSAEKKSDRIDDFRKGFWHRSGEWAADASCGLVGCLIMLAITGVHPFSYSAPRYERAELRDRYIEASELSLGFQQSDRIANQALHLMRNIQSRQGVERAMR